MDYLSRDQAPFPPELWRKIDDAAIAAARDRLSARRFLPLEGPFGIGLTAIECGNDESYRQPRASEAASVMGRTQPVPMIRQIFRISIRRIAAMLENGQPLDLTPAADAAEAVADREDELIYQGQPDLQLPGLLNMDGRQEIAAGDWTAIDRALDDVLAAATLLDEAGYRGPYALALAPALYNGLFRLYPGTDVMQLEHLRRLCTRGIFKAPIEGGILARVPGGRLRFEALYGRLVASVEGYQPTLPRALYTLTQVPVHHLWTRLHLLHVRGRQPAPGVPVDSTRRLAAAAIDVSLCIALGVVLGRRRRVPALLGITAGYHLACWTVSGRTVGGALMKQRVVSIDGSGLSAGQALVRLASLPFAVARRRNVHDEIAGTEVVADGE